MIKDAADALTETLHAHGVAFRREGDLVILPDSGLVLRGEFLPPKAQPSSVMVQFNVGASSPRLSGRAIWESYAGIGEDENTARANALVKYLMSAFHVLLNALGDHACEDDGTAWTEWRGAHTAWRVCDSALVVQGGDAQILSGMYGPFLEQVRAAFEQRGSAGLHWLSVFFAVWKDGMTADVRLDGEPWPEAISLLRQTNFGAPSGYISGRHFLVAVPTISSETTG